MNKAEAIEAIKRLIKDGLDGKGYLDDTINFIEPTVDEAWEVIAEKMGSESVNNYYLYDLQQKIERLKDTGPGKRKSLDMITEMLEKMVSNDWEPRCLKLEKVVIPKFVAEWLELCKGIGLRLSYSMTTKLYDTAHEELAAKLRWWLDKEENDNLFAKAWLDDYEVEKEKLYRVELPVEINSTIVSVLKKYHSGEVNIGLIRKAELKTATRIRFTEQQIKSIDERYWAFAVEVEETDNEI